MEKVFKNKVFLALIGLLLGTCVTVGAVNYYCEASTVKYNDTNVTDALNELYNVKPVLKKTQVWTGTLDESVKSTTTISHINLSSLYTNYQKITADNIGVEQTDLAGSPTSFGGCSTSWNYAPNTGVITLTLTARKGFPDCGKQSYNVYVYTAELSE